MLDDVLNSAPAFLMAAVRCFALLATMPLFSMRNVPTAARVALAAFMAYIVLPSVDYAEYSAYMEAASLFTLPYLLLLAGEALIGIITGFFVSMIFSAFSTAGQFFAFQMGFSASEVYDALSQVENPLMGQYLNMLAMLYFMQEKPLKQFFFGGLVASFKSLTAYSIANSFAKGGVVAKFMTAGLSRLFVNALVLALPLMCVLMLITISVGILSKAAPQMNLLSEGFPVMILTAFFVLMALIPAMFSAFGKGFEAGFSQLEAFFREIGKQI